MPYWLYLLVYKTNVLYEGNRQLPYSIVFYGPGNTVTMKHRLPRWLVL